MKARGWVFTAGLLAFDRSGAIVGTTPGRAGAGAQTRQALENLDTVLRTLGGSFGEATKVNGPVRPEVVEARPSQARVID